MGYKPRIKDIKEKLSLRSIGHYRSILLVALFLLTAINLNGLSSLTVNLGMVQLNKSLVSESANADGLEKSEKSLELALALNSRNLSAIRGLGYAKLYQGDESGALRTWNANDEVAIEFLSWGSVAQNVNHLDEALIWFERAAKINPKLADAWYSLGTIYFDLELWDEAVNAFDNALSSEYFIDIGESDVYHYLGVLFQQSPEKKDNDQALEMFDLALAINSFGYIGVKAESFHKRGVIYEVQGRDLQQSILEYENALLVNPQHQWALLRLGNAIYWDRKDLNQAESEIRRAISLWPNDESKKWPYRFLGDIYRDAGLVLQAIEAYNEAIFLDPSDNYVNDVIMQLSEHQE